MSSEQIVAVLAAIGGLIGSLAAGYRVFSSAAFDRKTQERKDELEERREFVPRADVEAMQTRHDKQIADLRADYDRQLDELRQRLAARDSEISELHRLVTNLTSRPRGARDRADD